jgi:hypothetical protein
MRLMHKLAKLSDAERRRIIHQFIDDAVGGLDANPELVARLRSAMPELPDDPSPEQVDAWVELAELVQDPDFKASVRRMAELQATERAAGERSGSGLHHELTNQLRVRIEAARAAGSTQPPSRAAFPWPIWSPGTPRPSARPTPPTTAASCWVDCRPPTIHGLSGTGSCLASSMAGPRHRSWLRCSSGASTRSSITPTR